MNTAQKLREKGFTLIELLVVIAVLGILASVVLVAINPKERISDAKDAGVKSMVGQVKDAVEACYTNNGIAGSSASYTSPVNCSDVGELDTAGYLKSETVDANLIDISADATRALVSGELNAQTNVSAGGCTGAPAYFVFDSDNGQTTIQCSIPAL